MVGRICGAICQSAAVLAQSDRGRGIVGVRDGFARKVVEDKTWIKWRRDFLRQVGYQQ